jgi:HD-GYP domain-containing protein (c-di-GMP phosphodiesterase class II)
MANLKINRLLNRFSKQKTNGKPIKFIVDYKDWVQLPATIKGKRIQAQGKFPSLQDDLILYRAYVITCNYIATNIDRGILDSYKLLQHEMKDLLAIEENNFLRLISLKSLRSINERWDLFIERQKELQLRIEQAPSAFSFYNKMASFKEKHHRERKEGLEISQKLSRAYQALDTAMTYIEKYDQDHSVGEFGASVLSFEKAREYWGQKLEEIRNLENENADFNLIINEIDHLARIIYDAPSLAKWVNDLEKRYSHLVFDHELLVNSYGKVIIQKEILEEMNTIITSIVPKLWIKGQKNQINQYLEEVDKFLGIYEPEVQTEIAFAERHNPRKQTQASEQEQSLTHLVEVTKLFMAAMDVRDPTMSSHSLTVTRLAVATGKVMNWSQEEIQYLEIAALLHDVGKLWVPEPILTKKGKLNPEDIRMLRMHPVYGAQILQSSGLFEKISPWIYYHQELWNGTGYPDGIKEDAIPIQSRVISVCEAFAAMLTGSPNRSPLTIDQALERIKYEAGSFFDPVVVQSFVIAVESQEMDYLKKFVEK